MYPSNVSLVFFVGDSSDPAWKVVLRHDARSKRIQGDREVHIFGAPGSTKPTPSSRSMGIHGQASTSRDGRTEEMADVVPAKQFFAFVHEEELPDDDAHLDDTQFLDEMEIQYVE